jgi:transcriptional regulator with XRE-family HTH domain
MQQQFSPALVRALRESRGLSRTKLAARLDLTDQTIYSWACGTTEPRLNLLTVLCHELGCRIDDLFEPVTDDEAR